MAGNGRTAYHPVVRLGEAPGERVDAVGDVGERAGGGRGGEDRCSDSGRIRPVWLEISPERSITIHERGKRRVVSLTGDVALLGRPLDVGGGLDHGDVEVLALAAAAAAVHLGDPHGGGVLDGAARLPPPLPHRHRAHWWRRRRRAARRPSASSRSRLSLLGASRLTRALSRRRRRRLWPARGQILLFKIPTTNSEMARRARLFR